MHHSVRIAIGIGIVSLIAVSAQAESPRVLGEGHSPRQPQIAVTDHGNVDVVFGAGDAVYHCRSNDAGRTFSEPRLAFRVPNLSLGMRRGPRISVVGSTVVVTAIGGQQGKGRDGDLFAWRSSNGGLDWDGPVQINTVTGSAREGLHGMTSEEHGAIGVTWLDLRSGKTEVYFSRSVDGGSTWQPDIKVYASPDGSVCECCHPSIVMTKDRVEVLFRNALGGCRDMYLATSRDQGHSFVVRKIGAGTWNRNTCPMDGGMIALGSDGPVTVWRRENQIYLSRNDRPEQQLGRGEQPWIASASQGPVLAWTVGREGDLMVQRPGDQHPRKLASHARDPVLSASRDGLVMACWEGRFSGNPVVMVTRLDSERSVGIE